MTIKECIWYLEGLRDRSDKPVKDAKKQQMWLQEIIDKLNEVSLRTPMENNT